MADRIFTHPVPASAGQLRTKHFQKQAQGMHGQTRLTQIESQHPGVDRNYKHGIMIEVPNQKPQIFFGDYHTVNGLAAELKKGNVDQVAARLRVTQPSQTGMHYLGKPAPPNMQEQMTPQEMEKTSVAHKIYPNQGDEGRPRSVAQEEAKALKEHHKELAANKQMYPSSVDGQAAIAKETAPQGGTALTGGE